MKNYTLAGSKLLIKKEPVEIKPKTGLYIETPKDDSVAKGLVINESTATAGYIGKQVYYNKYLCVNVIDKEHCVLKIEDALVFEEEVNDTNS